MLPEELPELIKLYLKGTCTPAQKEQVEKWYEEHQFTEMEFYNQDEVLIADSAQRSLTILKRKILSTRPEKTKSIRLLYIAAAVMLVLLSAGLMMYKNFNTSSGNYYVNDIAPGKNKAVLKLADGSKIVLDNAANGNLVTRSGIRITKTKDGQLVFSANAASNQKITPSNGHTNTITTPRGGQYQVELPDGTVVWLNAASSLQFPESFQASQQRRVTLTGEAYFQVARDTKRPFIVHTNEQDVKVLGTHFNINSYKEEAAVKTTLLEGSVELSFSKHTLVLKPGEQAVRTGENLQIHTVDTEDAIAWKNGKLKFSNENIRDLMHRIARWYDVEVVYDGNMTNKD
ncbi:FecR family protein, partial [Pedobacter sp.]|uniref:FecR family protein n=1 Tax=Pedobacter sp. TaxID=1411316 RepID=UPI002CC93FF5